MLQNYLKCLHIAALTYSLTHLLSLTDLQMQVAVLVWFVTFFGTPTCTRQCFTTRGDRAARLSSFQEMHILDFSLLAPLLPSLFCGRNDTYLERMELCQWNSAPVLRLWDFGLNKYAAVSSLSLSPMEVFLFLFFPIFFPFFNPLNPAIFSHFLLPFPTFPSLTRFLLTSIFSSLLTV